MKSLGLFLPVLIAPVLLTSVAFAAAPNYAVVSHFPIGGDASSYDYLRVDPTARRLYVAHEKRFEVLDADSGKKLGEIAPTTRAHGVAIASDSGHGFATSGIDDQVTMFDLKTLATIKQIKSTGSNPDSVEYDPESKKIYVGNHGSGEITVLDPASGDVVTTIKFGDQKLEGICFDGRGQGFVNAEDKSAVLVFDTHTLKPKATWSSAPGEGGTGLAIDAAHHRLFSACANNKVVVLDSDTGKVVATPEIGADPDGIAFDPKSNRLFTPNPDGTMSIVQENSPDSYSSLQTVTTAVGCKTIAFDEKTGRVFTAAPQFGPKPAQVKGGPRPRAPILAGTFEVVVVGVK